MAHQKEPSAGKRVVLPVQAGSLDDSNLLFAKAKMKLSDRESKPYVQCPMSGVQEKGAKMMDGTWLRCWYQ